MLTKWFEVAGRRFEDLILPNVGLLSDKRLIRLCDIGIYDGIRIDRLGNIWAGAGDGVHRIAPDGTLLGQILLPEATANMCFGGPKRNRLFICATRSLYTVYLNVTGNPAT